MRSQKNESRQRNFQRPSHFVLLLVMLASESSWPTVWRRVFSIIEQTVGGGALWRAFANRMCVIGVEQPQPASSQPLETVSSSVS